MYLVVACIAAGAVLQIIMRTYGFIEVNGLAESLMFGFLFSVPVRAFAGYWVAWRDEAWRSAIVLQRNARKQKSQIQLERRASNRHDQPERLTGARALSGR